MPPPTLWRHHDFLKLWMAKTISDFGSLISRAALAFTAILWLKATPLQLSALMVADLLPRFLIGLVMGVWVDRLRRRPLMILADVARALLLVSIPLAAWWNALHIEQLYLVTLGTGILSLLFDVADRSFLPTLVETEQLTEANSKLTAMSSVASFGAFALAGWLVQTFTGPIAVLIDAASFLISALLLSLIRKPEPPRLRPDTTRTPQETLREFGNDLKEGLTAVRRHPLLAALTVSAFLIGLAMGLLGTVMVAFMARDLGFKPGILGMIWAIGGVTSLLGAIAAGPLTRRLGLGKTLIIGLLLAAIGVFATTLAHGATWLSAGFLIANQVIGDPGFTLYEINQVSLRQSLVEERLQGRVNATFEFIGLGATLLGTLLAGWLGEKSGLRALVAAGAVAMLLAALWLSLSAVRHAETPEPKRLP